MDSDAAVWIWAGRYLWAPMMAIFGAVALSLWNGVNKDIEKKANSVEVFRELVRIENMVDAALERRIFDDYIARANDQRREDRLAVISQFDDMKANQSAILDKIDKITALLLQSDAGRRSGDHP